jgi:hypothetical protein
MIVNKLWKLTNNVRVGLCPRSSHAQRQTTFPDKCVLLFPLCHVVSHCENLTTFCFSGIFFQILKETVEPLMQMSNCDAGSHYRKKCVEVVE